MLPLPPAALVQFQATPAPAPPPRGSPPLPFRLEVLRWLDGDWTAEDGPLRVDDHWRLEGGSLMGTSRTLAGDRSTSFELMVLEPAPEGWVLRLRMFGPSLDTATRGRETPLRLRVVEADSAHLLLEGLGPETGTRVHYLLESPRTLRVEISKPKDGQTRMQTFRFTRTR